MITKILLKGSQNNMIFYILSNVRFARGTPEEIRNRMSESLVAPWIHFLTWRDQTPTTCQRSQQICPWLVENSSDSILEQVSLLT